MTQFTFQYSGETRKDISEEQVRAKLAKLFSVDPSDWDGVFSGELIFERTDLIKEVALEYQKNFLLAGAIGKIQEINATTPASRPHEPKPKEAATQTPTQIPKEETRTQPTAPPEPVIDDNVCPKCKAPKTDPEKCTACGIYFHKIRPQTPDVQEDENDNFEVTELDEESRVASKLFRIATLLVVVVFIADEFLSGRTLAGFSHIDIGYIPYVAAHLFLIYACARFAQVKGYSPVLGALGLLSVAGVTILLALPDKANQQLQITKKNMVLLTAFMAAMLVWLVDFGGRQSDLSKYITQAEQLAEERSHYPAEGVANNEAIQTEQQELEAFFKSLFTSMETHSFRPSELEALMDLSLSEASKYRVWLNYQRYLTSKESAELPSELTSKLINKNEKTLSTLSYAFVNNASEVELHPSRADWVMGVNPDRKGGMWASKFGNALFDLGMQIRGTIMNQQMNGEEITINLTQMELNEIPGTRFEVTEDTIQITITQGFLKDRFMVLGVYKTATRKGPITKKPIYYVSVEPIYMNFPSKYLSGDMNPLKRYQLDREW